MLESYTPYFEANEHKKSFLFIGLVGGRIDSVIVNKRMSFTHSNLSNVEHHRE